MARKGKVKPNSRPSPGPLGNTTGPVVPQTEPNLSGSTSKPPAKAESPKEKGYLEGVKEGIDEAIDKAVEGAGFGTTAMVLGAVAKAVNEVFMPTAAWELIPVGKGAKILKKGGEATGILKKTDEAADAAKEVAKTGKGGRVDGPKKRPWEIGKCGEWLAKNDLREQGYDEILEVQNKSGHGVDVVGRNSQTGEVKVLEVKTTSTDAAPPLSKDQREMGGKDYTDSRVERAAKGKGHYKNSPAARANALKVQGWLDDAGKLGNKVSHEKYDVFIEDPAQGCIKKKAKGSPWLKPK